MHELSANLERLLLIHRLIGYPVAFLVAPLALATFAGRGPHRWAGIAYGAGMLVLYVTGSVLTFTQYSWASWEFGRNVVFNLTGALFVALGVRAIWRWRRQTSERPERLDNILLGLLVATISVMFGLAVLKNTPLRVFTLLGVLLIVMEYRDRRAGFTRAVLYARHVRYILASYFYLLTVVSLVHLRDELSANARWLWPTLLGGAALWIAHGAVTPGNPWRTRWQRSALVTVVVVTLAFGGYALAEVRRDGLFTRPSPPPEAVRGPG